MDPLHMQNSGQENTILEADKKALKIESVILIILGAILLIVNILITSSGIYWYSLPLCLLYICAGISGLISMFKNSAVFFSIFKVLVYVSIFINVVFSVLAAILFVYLIVNPVDCSKSDSDNCVLGQAVVYIIEIIIVISIIVNIAIIFFFVLIIKHSKRYSQDKELASLI